MSPCFASMCPVILPFQLPGFVVLYNSPLDQSYINWYLCMCCVSKLCGFLSQQKFHRALDELDKFQTQLENLSSGCSALQFCVTLHSHFKVISVHTWFPSPHQDSVGKEHLTLSGGFFIRSLKSPFWLLAVKDRQYYDCQLIEEVSNLVKLFPQFSFLFLIFGKREKNCMWSSLIDYQSISREKGNIAFGKQARAK